jgi:hypothetical protein
MADDRLALTIRVAAEEMEQARAIDVDERHDPLWQHVLLPYRGSWGALGLGLRLCTNDPSVLAMADASFGPFARPPDDRVDLRFHVVRGPDGDRLHAGELITPFHRERGHLYCAGDGRSVVVADLATGQASAFITPGTPPPVARSVLLESPVWRLAAFRGLVALHAATVVIGDVTFVLRGPAGAGKSTLAYAAARAGHALVAEEVTWYDPGTGDPCLRGAPWQLHLEPEAVALFPELTGRLAVPAASGPKLDVETAAIPGAAWAELAPPGPMVLLRPAAGPTELGPLDPDKARAAFEATALPGERSQRADRLAGARDRLIGHGAFGLRPGRPDEAIAALERLAERLRDG